MFTGIIETTGTVTEITGAGTNRDIWIEASITQELKIDQSVAHNGVCLTVTEISGSLYKVTAVQETLVKTNFNNLHAGNKVNLERSLKVGDRLDGHFVQGHIDATGTCTGITAQDGSWLFTFSFPGSFAPLLVEKGSVCINGVSLTAFNVTNDEFTVAIIPYTFHHTTFSEMVKGDKVNIEFDILGKYMLRRLNLQV